MSLKQTLSLQELEQQLTQIRQLVEEGCSSSKHRSLSWYMMPDEENTLASQVDRFVLYLTLQFYEYIYTYYTIHYILIHDTLPTFYFI